MKKSYRKITVKEKRFKRFLIWYGPSKKGTNNEEGD